METELGTTLSHGHCAHAEARTGVPPRPTLLLGPSIFSAREAGFYSKGCKEVPMRSSPHVLLHGLKRMTM